MKKKSKLEKLTPLVIGTCMLTLVAACGSDDDDSGSGAAAPQAEEEIPVEGQYRVVFAPVNPNIAGQATASGEIGLQGDEFTSTVTTSGLTSGIHRQHIHVGNRCPGAGDDTNGDGYIDAVEASAVTGGALIPLDSNLRAQEVGVYPVGRSYNYNQSTSYAALLADLQMPDPDPADTFVKLGAEEDLNLEGKVVEIHGVPSATSLPPTVRGQGDLSPHQGLPLLCGVITRVQPETEPAPTPAPEQPAPVPGQPAPQGEEQPIPLPQGEQPAPQGEEERPIPLPQQPEQPLPEVDLP